MAEEKIREALIELRQSSMSISSSSDFDFMIRKYDLMFLGEKYNVINSLELRHTLSNYFGFNASNEALNELLPNVCSSLGMRIEPMAAVDDLHNPNPYCYRIVLW